MRAQLVSLAGRLERILPTPLVWFLRAEAGLVRAWWWAARGRTATAPGETPLSYGSRLAVMLWTTVGLSVLELAVVHVLVPWPVARWVLLGAGVYGLFWLAGLALSVRQRPHVVRADELVVRFAHLRETLVPLRDLVGERVAVVADRGGNVVLDGAALALPIAGETNVELSFAPPVAVAVKGRAVPVERLSFFADDPRRAVRALRTQTAPGTA